MQINMQMRLAKLEDSDWQVGAVGEWPLENMLAQVCPCQKLCARREGTLARGPQRGHRSLQVCTVLRRQWLVLVNTQLNMCWSLFCFLQSDKSTKQFVPSNFQEGVKFHQNQSIPSKATQMPRDVWSEAPWGWGAVSWRVTYRSKCTSSLLNN